MISRLRLLLANIAPKSADSGKLSEWKSRQTRVIHIGLLLILVVCSAFFWRAWQWQVISRIFSLGFCAFLVMCAMLLLYWRVSAMIVGNIAILGANIAAFNAAYTSGGLGQVAASWLYLVPMAAGLMLGRKMFLVWAGVTLLEVGVLFSINQWGEPLINLTPEAYRVGQNNLQQITQMIFVILMSFSYLNQFDLYRRENQAIAVKFDNEINDRKQAERAAVIARQEGGRLINSMSHELRTPLNAIIGFSHRLKIKLDSKGTLAGEKSSNALDSIYRNGHFLLLLINDILELAKIEVKDVTLAPQSLNISQTIEQVIDSVKPVVGERDIYIHNNCEPEQVIVADPVKFSQIVENLINNALMNIESGGLTINSGESDRLLAGEGVYITFTDTGSGFSVEDQHQLFNAYSMVQTPIAKIVESTGLEMALTLKWVQLHGGEIDISSGLGQGSQIVVHLPKDARCPYPPIT